MWNVENSLTRPSTTVSELSFASVERLVRARGDLCEDDHTFERNIDARGELD